MDTRPRTQTGFTLLELLMTIAVAAIVTMIAVPSFRYVTNSNRIAGEVNGLLGDLQFARSEAIKEGRTVTVCVSTSGAGCTGGTAWENGWIVFSDQGTVGTFDGGGVDTLLRVQPKFSGTDTFAATNTVSVITFNRMGYATGIAAGTVVTLHDFTNTTLWTRCLSITFNGLMSSLKHDGATCN